MPKRKRDDISVKAFINYQWHSEYLPPDSQAEVTFRRFFERYRVHDPQGFLDWMKKSTEEITFIDATLFYNERK